MQIFCLLRGEIHAHGIETRGLFDIIPWTTENDRLKHKKQTCKCSFAYTYVSVEFKTISLQAHQLWISLLIEFNSKTDKRNITEEN